MEKHFDDVDTRARVITGLFGGSLLAISAVTSAAFFFQYTPHLFDFIAPSIGPILAAATGVLVFELASVAWAWMKAHDAKTHGQILTATVGAWFAMLGGLAVTAVYFTLNNALLTGVLDETTLHNVSVIGGLLIILGVGGHFALGFMYRISAKTHMEAQKNAKIAAMKFHADSIIEHETTNTELANTLQSVRKRLPQHGAQHGEMEADRHIRDREPVNPTRAPSAQPNGRNG